MKSTAVEREIGCLIPSLKLEGRTQENKQDEKEDHLTRRSMFGPL